MLASNIKREKRHYRTLIGCVAIIGKVENQIKSSFSEIIVAQKMTTIMLIGRERKM